MGEPCSSKAHNPWLAPGRGAIRLPPAGGYWGSQYESRASAVASRWACAGHAVSGRVASKPRESMGVRAWPCARPGRGGWCAPSFAAAE